MNKLGEIVFFSLFALSFRAANVRKFEFHHGSFFLLDDGGIVGDIAKDDIGGRLLVFALVDLFALLPAADADDNNDDD